MHIGDHLHVVIKECAHKCNGKTDHSMTIPALSSHAKYTLAAIAEKEARALNRLGANCNLLDSADALLDLIDDYFFFFYIIYAKCNGYIIAY